MLAQQLRTYYVPDWTAISAIGTLLAVAVALFWEPLRRWWNAPALKVTWRERDSETHATDDFGATATTVRLLVTNTGRSAAQRIELTIADVYRRGKDKKLTLVPGFLPTALVWTHTTSPRWENLAPQSCRLCDLGSFVEIPPLPALARTHSLSFVFATEVQPKSGYNRLEPGAYVARIVATAVNCRRADLLTIAINVGPHVIDGKPQNFSIFDPAAVAKVEVNALRSQTG